MFCFSLKHKGFLSSADKKVVLSRSSFNFFLGFFCKLKKQFLQVWENFAPPSGIQPSFFASGQGIRQKNLPRVAGIRSLKKIFPGVARRGGCTQLELTETLQTESKILPYQQLVIFFLSLYVSFETKFFNWYFDSLVLGLLGLWTPSEKKLISDDICVELVSILSVSMAASLF